MRSGVDWIESTDGQLKVEGTVFPEQHHIYTAMTSSLEVKEFKTTQAKAVRGNLQLTWKILNTTVHPVGALTSWPFSHMVWLTSCILKTRSKVDPDCKQYKAAQPRHGYFTQECTTTLVVRLTVPQEERLFISNQLMKAKYQDLRNEALLQRWHAAAFPINVTCHGFPATLLHYFLQTVGFEPKQVKKASGDFATVPETSTRWLCLMRAHSRCCSLGEI